MQVSRERVFRESWHFRFGDELKGAGGKEATVVVLFVPFDGSVLLSTHVPSDPGPLLYFISFTVSCSLSTLD